MKFCKDCRHILLAPNHSTPAKELEFAKCAQSIEVPASLDMVSGEGTPAKYHYCSIAREHGYCGKEAKLFAPKLEEVSA